MIFDNIKNCNLYSDPRLQKGFEFLKNADLQALADGRYEIEGNNIFANVQSLKTKPKNEKKWEAHKKYIDIQYVIKGFETMGFGLLKNFNRTLCPYDNDKDIAFLDSDCEKYGFVNVGEGDFTVFYPNDVHAPMLAFDKPQDIKKVIVKIKI